jgi:hypothetical protein
MLQYITLHENMTKDTNFWENPNIFPGDKHGKRINPKVNDTCYLWASPKNLTDEILDDITVTFYIIPPGGQLHWAASPYGEGRLLNIQKKATALIKCANPWTPTKGEGSKTCIVATVSCDKEKFPTPIPGEPIPLHSNLVGQCNVAVNSIVSKQAVHRFVNVTNASNDGYLEMTREPLPPNRSLLELNGIPGNILESPDYDFTITDLNGGKLGKKTVFKKGDTLSLIGLIDVDQVQHQTGAIYRIRHYEKEILIGGVTQIIFH